MTSNLFSCRFDRGRILYCAMGSAILVYVAFHLAKGLLRDPEAWTDLPRNVQAALLFTLLAASACLVLTPYLLTLLVLSLVNPHALTLTENRMTMRGVRGWSVPARSIVDATSDGGVVVITWDDRRYRINTAMLAKSAPDLSQALKRRLHLAPADEAAPPSTLPKLQSN